MERLTVNRNGVWHFEDWERGIDCTGKAVDHLAAYEDTGLDPVQAQAYADCELGPETLTAIKQADLLGKFARWAQAEKDGRLWLSPFPLNDSAKLYAPRKNDVQEQTVQYITLLDGEPSVAVSFDCDYECAGCPHNAPYTNYEAGDGGCDGEGGFGVILISEIGKTVFLTRAEAEAALRGDKR
ncbi:MAG: hypothetical protein VB053_03400 [Oscillibacter ruminantium]|uniref:hypothetical protein n=1 Tax=Oscillibacter ruminantium TaxID=1263547 RepID=UPI002B214886|nr:hypothetical protein [Oscillibacter ruminantium]MEA5041570.1 hypothetical protein [Oscillibacter ruminantium]